MRLVSLQMRGSVVRNYIFIHIWRCYGPKRDILEYWGTIIYMIDYPIIYYRKIKVYRVETINVGRSHCNNGVSGTILQEELCQRKIQSW